VTQHHTTTDSVRRPTPPEHTPRLRLKPKAPHTGYVDGGMVAV
jgi:7-keto-8-aminopelargonate synthetase-like enzyme